MSLSMKLWPGEVSSWHLQKKRVEVRAGMRRQDRGPENAHQRHSSTHGRCARPCSSAAVTLPPHTAYYKTS